MDVDDHVEIDLDHQDHLGNTAIILASIHGHVCVRELLDGEPTSIAGTNFATRTV